jgi:phage-related protein
LSPNDVRFEVELFRDVDGQKPVATFLRSLSSNVTLALNTKAAIKALQDGLLHREPFTKALGEGLYEARVEGKDAIRILYFYAGGRRVVIVHAFQKKTQKTPQRELTIANQRKRRFERQEREDPNDEDRPRSRTR